jgi:gas vesicle protein
MNSYMQDVRRALVSAGIIQRESSFLTPFVIGAGVGIVAGASLALLYTPRTGPEMRRQLGRGAKKLAERTQGALEEVKENVKGKVKGLAAKTEASTEDVYRTQ